MTMNASLIVELALMALLSMTLVTCIVLERKLSALRKGQDGLKDTIGELNSAIVSAGASMRALKAAAGGAAETLDARLHAARAMTDELSLLTASGERIAERIAGASSRPANPVLPASLAGRLDKLRPQAMGAMR
jgi:Domain of unknown function (DUF6468)